MIRRRFAWAALAGAALALGACKKHTEQVRPLHPPESGPAAASPAASPSPGAAPAPALIVSNEQGTWILGPDGKRQRRISATPASSPRWLPGRQALLFLTPGNNKSTTELRRVNLDGKGEKTVATLQTSVSPCKDATAESHTYELSVQSGDDFVVDAKKNVACIRMLDRNENMADFDLSMQVDLASGAVQRRTFHGANCELVSGLTTGDRFECDDGRPAPGPTQEGAALPDQWEIEAQSPSHRWSLIRGNEDDEDYIHFDALLFDHQTKQLFALKPGPWPKPLAAASTADLEALRGADKTAGIVGESDVRWLADDLLIVDGLVVRPGKRIFDIKGEVIR